MCYLVQMCSALARTPNCLEVFAAVAVSSQLFVVDNKAVEELVEAHFVAELAKATLYDSLDS